MKRLLLAATVLTGIAAPPFMAQAAPDSWTGTTSSAWETSTNWSAGTPIFSSAVTIGNTTNNPVQLNSNVFLTGGALTVGAGTAPGTPAVLNINTGDTLTMGARPVILAGGSITGPGTLSTTGTISGFGTISSQISGTSFTANATDGTTYGFPGGNFVNGTPGTPITLIGQNNLTNDSFTVSAHGDFNFQGVTLTTPTLIGVSTNLSGGPSGGNNTYGLFSFTGAASTIVGNVNNTNYQQFDINGTTLHLNNFSLSNSWATNVPPFFVIGAGGTLDNTVGNSNLTGHMAVVLNGGAITNSGGGTFTAPGVITGNGSVSGITLASGGVTANGGTLTVNGGTGMSVVSAGWGTAGGASDVLDLKGALNFIAAQGFPAAPGLSPNGATVQLDGATINTAAGNGSIQTGHGQITVASGTNTLNGSFTANGFDSTTANYTVKNGATLGLQNNSGTTAIAAKNFSMEKGSVLTIGSAHDALSLAGNFSFQQTDAVNAWNYAGTPGLGPDVIMTGGTSLNPTTLEVGGINKGNVAAGFIDNFALHSLSIGGSAYVELVDQYANATTTGWTSGSEALYLDALYDASGIGTLNLDGLSAYVLGYGMLQNGIYTDPNGGQIDIVGAPLVPVPEPMTLSILGVGLFGLGMIRRRKTA